MRSLKLTVSPCHEDHFLCPQALRPEGSIPVCATIVASEIHHGTLTIGWDKTEARLVLGEETVELLPGSYTKHFAWAFMPLATNRLIHFSFQARADSLYQAAGYDAKV
jgi:hypothetical protein